MSFLGPLIGALGSLGGSLFGANAAEAGGRMSARATLKANRKNIKYQKLFAQKGIQWRAADARKAGIHPLAALGAQTTSFSPSVLGATQAGEGVAQAGNIMGQGLSRAAAAFGDIDDRNAAYTQKLQALQLENAQLNNTKLASEIAMINQPGSPPASPGGRYVIPGQNVGVRPNSTPDIVDNPLKRVVLDRDADYRNPGFVADQHFSRSKDGYPVTMSTDFQERAEDDMGAMLSWNIRNRLLQNFQLNMSPPHEAPEGKHWKYNPITQEYQLWDNRYSLKETMRDQLGQRRNYKDSFLFQ